RAADRVRRLATVAAAADHTADVPAAGAGGCRMSAKQLKVIALALVVVLLLWGGSELFSRGSDTVTGGLSFPALAQSDVDTISVIKGTDSVVLAKQSATAWTVNRRRAALDAVTDLFQALRDSAPPELVAQDSSSFGRLNV